MDKKRKKTMLCGEITAFLSLIFLLILSLVGTSLESARVNVGRSFADRSLQNAMESLYTEYCRPLWEDYHLFFLEGEESEDKDEDYLRNTMYEYMESTYNEEQGILSIVPSMNLLEMEVRKLDIVDIVRADEYEGELLLHEILEYEKYQVDDVFLSNQKKLVAAMKEMNASMTVVEKQMEAEEKMAEVNLEILNFISAVEGISVGKTGFLWQRNGLLRTEPYFVKQFSPQGITRNATGIYNEIVWNSLKQSFINPVLLVEEMEEEAGKLLVAAIEREREAEEAEDENDAGNQTGIFTDISSYIELSSSQNKLKETARGMLSKVKKAEDILEKIERKKSVFIEETTELEKVYEKQKEDLSAERQKVFEEEIGNLKKFVGSENTESIASVESILNMEPILRKNRAILEEVCQMERIYMSADSEEIRDYLMSLSVLKWELRSYQIQSLQFNYSSLKANTAVEDPTEVFSEGYEKNLLNLVVKDTSAISKKRHNGLDEVKVQSGFEWDGTSVDEQLQKILLSCYIENHFSDYLGQTSEKETVLDYEIEYILGGKRSDKENLEEMVKKLVTIRTALNYMYLITDREKVDMAHATALALVGCSGMPPLVQLTKNLILMTWATEEAIVDTAALLQGKEVELFKTKRSFQIQYQELLSFGRGLVQTKAANRSSAASGLGMDYEEYLKLLLNMTGKQSKLSGMMELIEGNIQLRYDEGFEFEKCIYGIEVLAEFRMKEKFVKMPGVRTMLPLDGEGFTIQSHQSYCYE